MYLFEGGRTKPIEGRCVVSPAQAQAKPVLKHLPDDVQRIVEGQYVVYHMYGTVFNIEEGNPSERRSIYRTMYNLLLSGMVCIIRYCLAQAQAK